MQASNLSSADLSEALASDQPPYLCVSVPAFPAVRYEAPVAPVGRRLMFWKKDREGGGDPIAVGESDVCVDSARLAMDLTAACCELDQYGYDVLQVIDVLNGNYSYDWRCWERKQSAGGYGYGYSTTAAIVIVAKKRVVPCSSVAATS